MARRSRRQFSSEQKADILRRHLADEVPISDLCDELKLQPSLLYQWLRQLLDNAAAALTTTRSARRREQELEEKVTRLEAKLARKDAIIAEISEEYVQLKKELGEP
jgi:transposase-like protein